MSKKYENLLTVGIIVLPGLVFGFMGKTIEMGIAVAAGALSAAFLNIDKIQRFKGAGFEAEMKKAVEEAYATMDVLREVAGPLIASAIDNITHANRLGGMDIIQEHKYLFDLENTAKKLKITPSEIEASKVNFYKHHTWDYFDKFKRSVLKNPVLSNESKDGLVEMKDRSSSVFPTIDQIKELLGSDFEKLTHDEKSLWDEYEYYLNNRKPKVQAN